MMNRIVPSILVNNKKDFSERMAVLLKVADRVQIDIMDGKFVTHRSLPLSDVYVPKSLYAEFHLMVERPLLYVKRISRITRRGMIIFHYESKDNVIRCISKIRREGFDVGIAINPETSASKIKPFLKLVDMVVVMTVHPGLGGQSFLKSVMRKLSQLRRWTDIPLEVDGGINKKTLALARKFGATQFIAGSAISNLNAKKDIKLLRTI